MPVICGIDCETSGLDMEYDRPTEVAYVIVDTTTWRTQAARSRLVRHVEPLTIQDEVLRLTGLTVRDLENHGDDPGVVGQGLMEDIARHKVTFMVAHNAQFDQSMLRKLHPDVDKLPWICTRNDVPYPDSMTSRRLVHLMAEHGLLNPFPHQALSDVQTMLAVLRQYNFDDVLRTALWPSVTLRAGVSYDDRDKGKKLRYAWCIRT